MCLEPLVPTIKSNDFLFYVGKRRVVSRHHTKTLEVFRLPLEENLIYFHVLCCSLPTSYEQRISFVENMIPRRAVNLRKANILNIECRAFMQLSWMHICAQNECLFCIYCYENVILDGSGHIYSTDWWQELNSRRSRFHQKFKRDFFIYLVFLHVYI